MQQVENGRKAVGPHAEGIVEGGRSLWAAKRLTRGWCGFSRPRMPEKANCERDAEKRIGHGHRQVHHDDARRAIGLEWKAPREQLEQYDPDGVDVAAAIDWVTTSLLGSHVVRRAAHDTRARDVRWRYRVLWPVLRRLWTT